MKGIPQGGLQQWMRQANQLQARMGKLKEELAEREYTGEASGGAVKAIVKGDERLTSLTIKADLAGDVEMIQDLTIIAVNEALKKAKEESATEMNKLTGGFSLF